MFATLFSKCTLKQAQHTENCIFEPLYGFYGIANVFWRTMLQTTSIIILHKFCIYLLMVAILENGLVVVFWAIKVQNYWSDGPWAMIGSPCMFLCPDMRILSVVIKVHPTLRYNQDQSNGQTVLQTRGHGWLYPQY